MSKLEFRYYVLITTKDGRSKGMYVTAVDAQEAGLKAQLQASLEGLPVFECKIEVTPK